MHARIMSKLLKRANELKAYSYIALYADRDGDMLSVY